MTDMDKPLMTILPGGPVALSDFADELVALRAFLALAAVGFACEFALISESNCSAPWANHETYKYRSEHDFQCVRCQPLCGPHDPLYRHQEFCMCTDDDIDRSEVLV